jgi:hypothetical protein
MNRLLIDLPPEMDRLPRDARGYPVPEFVALFDEVEEIHVDGMTIERNPGVTMIWETLSYEPFKVDNGWLIKVGDPEMSPHGARAGRPAVRS